MDPFQALLRVLFIGAMLLLFAGGGVGLLALWYLRGRDPHVGLVAEFQPTPPDDLPPGAAGTLLDEHADHHDIVATLLGLARHGAVDIVQVVPDPPGHRRPRRHDPADYELTLRDPTKCESALESELLRIIFGPRPRPGMTVRLSDIKPAFTAAEPEVRELLYDELVVRGYFVSSPEVTRQRWRRLAWVGLVLSILVGLALIVLVDPYATLPTVAAATIWGVMIRLSRSLPRKTALGAEAAAKWRAFRRYLAEIERYEDVAKSRELFERYLSYAVAFALDREWIGIFAAAGAPRPPWYHQPTGGDIFVPGDIGEVGDIGDVVTMGRAFELVGHLGRDAPNLPDLPGVGLPDVGGFDPQGIQGMSESLGGSLQDVSDGFGGLLDAAGSVFDAIDFG